MQLPSVGTDGPEEPQKGTGWKGSKCQGDEKGTRLKENAKGENAKGENAKGTFRSILSSVAAWPPAEPRPA
jgi:hypothetical protein